MSPADGIICGIGTRQPRALRRRARAHDGARVRLHGASPAPRATWAIESSTACSRWRRKWRVPIVLFAEGRRRAPERHRRADRRGPRHAELPLVRGALGPRAAGRDRLGPLLRRQRGAPRLLRRDHRDGGQQHRHGRTGDDRRAAAWGRSSPKRSVPSSVQTKNGVIDVRVKRRGAKPLPSPRSTSAYFQGRALEWACADQTTLRDALPERRRRAYKIRPIIETLADSGSVLELRRDFGREHRDGAGPHRGPRRAASSRTTRSTSAGAIDADAADKAARFLQLCDAFGLPDRVALRHARVHGRPQGGDDGARAARVADVRGRGEPVGAVLHGRPPEGLWARRAGDGGRALPRSVFHRVVADGRVRRNEPRGRRPARDEEAARGHRRSRQSGKTSSSRWSPSLTNAARPSTWRPSSRSTP